MRFTRALTCFILWSAVCACPPPSQNASITSDSLNQGRCLFRSILPSDTAVQVLMCVFVVMTIIALAINGCTLFSLGSSEDLSWEPRFALLKNLIVSDLLLTVTQGPTVVYCLLQKTTLPYGAWCITQFFIDTVCVFCTVLTITCMALERYLYVCQAIYYISILTTKRLNLIVSLTWLFSISFSAVITALLSLGHKSSLLGKPITGLLCEPDTLEAHLGFPRGSAVFRKVVGLVVTLLCICSYSFSYLRMYQEARNAVQPFQQVNKRARNTVMFYCSMLLLQLLPIFLKIASDALWELEGNMAMFHSLDYTGDWTSAGTLHIMLLVMLQVPPCINPLIYGLRNREVREALPRLLWWRRDNR
ncbi:olfactory receptor 2AG1-like protein [Labeo rohita]|uniref:Olfactory receptor 2AG1-like protein n=2 Tax=Labeo rohita TaxID=84645 RepID=A0A498MLU2_LABRO|nr:olfactory receptor 2G3 [Labeo rohita]KAI2649790.1 Olfactory receptor 2AG2 [Labeo rohita]RXN02732.1 olfactory receptor 2AG1-like protein [Labeo rohita]RXN22389.1 olfactory receptor 2AG1-like protein [Labeo rohita]